MNLYFISGLGADEKAFARIKLKDANIIHIKWAPHSREDDLSSYVQKLSTQIDTKNPFILVALSFGGIIAQEINKIVKPEKTILISSVTHHSHFPWFYQLGRYLIPCTPNFFFNSSNVLINYLFGAKDRDVQVLNNIMEANDPLFLKWCIQQLLRWRKKGNTLNTISIHGTNDKIIPHYKCDYTIKNGSHFMVYTKAGEVQTILQKEVDNVRMIK